MPKATLTPTHGTPAHEAPAPISTSVRLCGLGILLLTLGFVLYLSYHKLYWEDELFEFYSDTKPSAAAVLSGQLHYPFSLEPPSFHLLLHFTARLLPRHPEMATRLVSVLALLVTQISAFFITYRLTHRQRTALLAMALPFLFVTLEYGAEARVYSLLAALSALALLFYQQTVAPEHGARVRILICLYLSLAGAILVHYYGIFLPLPLLAAEALRSLRRKRIDWPTLLVLCAAFVTFAANVPLLRPLHEIQAHYLTGDAPMMMVPYTYGWLIASQHMIRFALALSPPAGAVFCTAVCLGALALVAFAVSLRRVPWIPASEHPALLALVMTFLLPVINVTFANRISHAYAPRYSLPAVLPLCILLAFLCSPWLRHKKVFVMLLGGVLALSCVSARHQAREQQGRGDKMRSRLALTPALRAALVGQHVYVQDLADFLPTYFYAPPELQADLIEFGSADRELFWLHTDTSALFSRNLGLTTTVPTTTYESIVAAGQPRLFLLFNDPKEEWIGHELAAHHACRVSLGDAFGGALYRVSFPPCETAQLDIH